MEKKIVDVFVKSRDKYGIIERFGPFCNDFDLEYRPYDNMYELVGHWKTVGQWITLAVFPAREVFAVAKRG